MKRDFPRADDKNLYILKGNKPVRADNAEQWLNWMKSEPRPSEQTTFASGRKMYTSFMGCCGERRESQPLTFATAFMPEPALPDFSIMLEWYYNWDEALAGHKRFAAQFKITSKAYSSKR